MPWRQHPATLGLMRLTTLTDYALRLLIYVGQHPDRLCTIAEIAQVYRISETHLMKITHRLAQHGWLQTVRGKHGGMRLAKPPQDINLGAVVRDTENDFALVECFTTGNACTITGRCGLTAIFSGALEHFLHYLDNYTLADVLPGNGKTAHEGAEFPVKFDRNVS